MQQFAAERVAYSIRNMEVWGCRYCLGAEFGDLALPHRHKHLLDAVQSVIAVCRDVGFVDAAHQVELILQRLTKTFGPGEFAAIRGQLLSIYDQIYIELQSRKFVRVEKDREHYIGVEHLFGAPVYTAFPSAREDIKDVGNCLAAECTTAAVFHLMRVAEIGLRVLAYDRNVTVLQNARTMLTVPLELATWEQLLKELEDAETAIQGYPKTLARTKQFEFYHGANMQVRAFKNVFRNSVMHSRDMYDRDEAVSLYRKVEEFMKILASKISEGARTPQVWI